MAGGDIHTRDIAFILPFSKYFSFVIGPLVCVSVLWVMAALRRKPGRGSLVAGLRLNNIRTITVAALAIPVLLSIAGPLAYLFVASPLTRFHVVNSAGLGQLLLFQVNGTQREYYTQLDSAIRAVPQNASLLADSFIMPHVQVRQWLEFPQGPLPFTPEYILTGANKGIGNSNICNLENCTLLDGMISSSNYSVYYQNGTAVLYRRGERTSIPA